jgi:hypothetical protein
MYYDSNITRELKPEWVKVSEEWILKADFETLVLINDDCSPGSNQSLAGCVPLRGREGFEMLVHLWTGMHPLWIRCSGFMQ